MVYRGSEILGNAVTSLRGGRLAGVTGLVIDPGEHRLLAVLVEEIWSPLARVVPLRAVEHWDERALRVKGREAIVWANLEPEIALWLSRPSVVGAEVCGEDGPLGAVADLYFDPATGVVLGYLVDSGRNPEGDFTPANQLHWRQGRFHPTPEAPAATPRPAGPLRRALSGLLEAVAPKPTASPDHPDERRPSALRRGP